MTLSLMVALLLGARAVAAQDPDSARPRGIIEGRVLSMDGVPLAAAYVSLTSMGPRDPATHVSRTTADGAYRFTHVRAGTYGLRVRRIGYRPASIEITLASDARLTVSPVLVVAPVMLQPLEVHAPRADPYARGTSADAIDPARLAIERWRQAAFLGSDVRALTHADVVESITLGTADAFRALHRLPGVTTRDDWTSELWIRGASWGQARVYFDELPLFNPVHGGGIISAVNADALGALLFHPGVRPVRLGEGSAGVVNLTSRAAAGDDELRGYGGISLTGGGLTLERRFADRHLGVLIGGRRSHLRLSASQLEEGEFGPLDFKIPDDYADVVARVDVALGEGRKLELSGLWERDWISHDLAGGPSGNRIGWGDAMARATVDLAIGPGYVRNTVGFSLHDIDVRQVSARSDVARFHENRPTQPESRGHVSYVTLKGELGSIIEDEPDGGWRAGYQVTRHRVSYRGAPAAPYPVQSVEGALAQDDALTTASIWGEARWLPAQHLTVQAGVRVEYGHVHDGSGLRLAPQVSARYRVSEQVSLSGGYGRTFQYLQVYAPVGLSVGPGLPIGYAWMLAGPEAPVVSTDLLSVGAEYWIDEAWLASITGYARHATGLTLVDPTPGRHGSRANPVIGENDAGGIDFSLRRLVGTWTASLGYSLSSSKLEAAGRRYPASWDRRHAIDATTTWHIPWKALGGRFTVGSAVTAMTGAPYTRFFPGTYDCDAGRGTCTAIVEDGVGEPNGARAPAYASVDAMIDWTRPFSAWELGWSMTVRNATTRRNAVTYDVTRSSPCRRHTLDDPLCGLESDVFEGWPSAQVILGLRVEF